MGKARSLYYLFNISRVIKSIKVRWTGHIARMEECRNAFKILTGKHIEKRPLGSLGLDDRTILERILTKQVSVR